MPHTFTITVRRRGDVSFATDILREVARNLSKTEGTRNNSQRLYSLAKAIDAGLNNGAKALAMAAAIKIASNLGKNSERMGSMNRRERAAITAAAEYMEQEEE